MGLMLLLHQLKGLKNLVVVILLNFRRHQASSVLFAFFQTLDTVIVLLDHERALLVPFLLEVLIVTVVVTHLRIYG